MRYYISPQLFIHVVLLACGNALRDERATDNTDGFTQSDTAVASIDKDSRSFVAPTHGSAYGLTLTTFLTDAAHLHYVVVPAGYSALDALGIKTAAAQCRSDVSTSNDVEPNNGVENELSANFVAANTITVPRAQKVVRTVEKLRPNSSYDVFFVAEVVDSNGVFGPVQSVLQTMTHPEPPEVGHFDLQPGDATADTVVLNATLTTLGRAYFALIPSDDDVQLTTEDLVQNRPTSRFPMAHFGVYTLEIQNVFTFQTKVNKLTPASLYDVFILTEAPGSGEVRSKVLHYPRKVRTHALAPEVVMLVCSPLNASATAFDVSFQLQVDQKDLDRVKLETLSYFTYTLHYEVTALSDGANKASATSNAASVSSGGAGSTRSIDDISVLKNTTVRGIFSMPNFSSVDDFYAGIQKTHHANITGLQSGTLYKVKLRVESAGSNGLFGLQELTTQASTHEEAPGIVQATIQAPNRSVSSLALEIELERQYGKIHYIIAEQSEATASLRSVFHQATSVVHLLDLWRDQFPQLVQEKVYTIGSLAFSSEKQVLMSETHELNRIPTRARPEKPVEKTEVQTFRQHFEITGLRDATLYSLVLLPETTNSYGLFGRAFHTVLEAHTNENASEIALECVKPLDGDTTAIQFEVNMTKPSDILYLCLTTQMSLEARQNETLHECREIEDRKPSKTFPEIVSFTVGDLSEDTIYHVSLYAENARRNGVISIHSEEQIVRTHKRAPQMTEVFARPTAATTSAIDVKLVVEAASPCIIHYIVRETQGSLDNDAQTHVDAATIVHHSFQTNDVQAQTRLPSSSSFVSTGHLFTEFDLANSTTFKVEKLHANTTYDLFVVTETSRDGNTSGVFGKVVAITGTTHAVAPTLVLATVDPVDGTTDCALITANLSHPGIVHYFISDVDFADPAMISKNDTDRIPHEVRGHFLVLEEHLVMEIRNGTNESQPTDPAVFVHNALVSGLKPGTTYHVSLTTETNESHGVFGDFPPPVLVNTHLGSPLIIQESFKIHPLDGSSSALAIEFALDRFGDVHYALFFRGLVPDRSQEFHVIPEAPLRTENGSNTSTEIWPPEISSFDLTQLSGSMLKAATVKELGGGVWVNDTISISREDMTRGKTSYTEIHHLPAHARFDVCLVTETAASNGILGWPVDGSKTACHRVTTHADYTNQSKLLDEISVHPLGGRTDAIHINLNVSKRLDAPLTTHGNVSDRFAHATGRVPYFVLLDAYAKSSRDLSAFVSHRGEVTNSFKSASPGRGDGVVAAGMLSNISRENATALIIEQNVYGLDANHEYLLYFAYETSNSNGVLTRINPHKYRGNHDRTENDGIRVTTLEDAPRLVKAKAQATFGHTSRITLKFEIACKSCKRALVHLLVFPITCTFPDSVTDTLRLDRLSKVETNVTLTSTLSNQPSEDLCTIPLIQKRIEYNMSERHDNRKEIEDEVGEDNVLAANTSYYVLLATETVGALGVLSPEFEVLQVCTHAIAPTFTTFQLQPRIGSTTELMLTFALDRPGEVHYMLGVSDNAEFNVTSPHNISGKEVPNGKPHGHRKDWHDYRTEVVRTRRSVTVSNDQHVELLDYLMPGTNYRLFFVSEALPADHGVYGDIHEVKQVSTFANAPILLAHAVYPTPGLTKSITVGFRLDGPGFVHFSALSVTPWDLMQHVAQGSDKYGNRLALQDHLVTQKSVDIDKASMEHESDSGWREVALPIPRTGRNYTVHIVTETKNSGGIYGTVATHTGVCGHSEAPRVINVVVKPTDARVDALTVNVTLSERGHVHYVAVVSGRGSEAPIDDAIHESTESKTRASGSVDVNATTGVQSTRFVVTGLTEGTSYDLFFRSETFESFGVFGSWTKEAVSARTHGLPADVLPEALECTVTPSCEQLGREVCSRKANICGQCLKGYGVESEEGIREGNEACVKLPSTVKAKRGPTIKINGVMRNPNLHLSASESETQTDVEVEPGSPDQEPIDLSWETNPFDPLKPIDKVEMVSEIRAEELGQSALVQTKPFAIRDSLQEVLEQTLEQEGYVAPDQQVVDGDAMNEYESVSNRPEISACPLNAQLSASGLCECVSGYDVDEQGASCKLSTMTPYSEATETATSTAFDIFSVHHHVSS